MSEGGAVILDRDRSEIYTLDEDGVDDALFRLAAIVSKEDVTGFVRRYGLLSIGPRNQVDELAAESLCGWQDAVFQARVTVELYLALGECSATYSVEPLRKLRSMVEQAFDGVPGEPRGRDECIAHYQNIFVRILKGALDQCEQVLIPASRLDRKSNLDEFVYATLPPTLQMAAYSGFANLVARRAEIRRCLHCGRIFQPKSGKQKFCSTTHANTNRSKRWRAKKGQLNAL